MPDISGVRAGVLLLAAQFPRQSHGDVLDAHSCMRTPDPRTADPRAPLEQALSELSELAPAADRECLAELARRLRSGRLRVLVAGEAKRGKSTVANALLGRDVLPAGVTPVTAVTTTVVYGVNEHVAVQFADGRAERRPLADLAALVTERGNPANRLGVSRVTVHLAAPLLARGVELVDTPGTGSIYEHNTEEAQRALETLDAAVMVLTADPPASASERDLLRKITGHSVMTFVLLNKADRLDAGERVEALGFTAEVVRSAAGPTGADIPVCAVSARATMGGHSADDGFGAFTASFVDYLDGERSADRSRRSPGTRAVPPSGCWMRCGSRSGCRRCAPGMPRAGCSCSVTGSPRSPRAARTPPT